jgi:ubiquinone/menaquinone biosynthesis C-methylase UbiE
MTLNMQARHLAASARQNYGLKDEIRDYWSLRSQTFDLSWGHKIRTDAELACWANLFKRHGAIAPGSRVLELASGTGEVTRALLHLGAEIDAIDLCEPMLARARAKHDATRHAAACVRFHLGDAENTMMPSAVFDTVVSRHLVWTLTDPATAFADWFRVLRPGGRLVIVDGDWVSSSFKSRLFKRLSSLVDRMQGVQPHWDQGAHERIMAQLPFCDGLRPDVLVPFLEKAGFAAFQIESLDAVRRHQWGPASWSERLRLLAEYGGNCFVVSAIRREP